MSERREDSRLISVVFTRNTNPSIPATVEDDATDFTDSFHKGGANADVFDTGLTRMFSIAIIEFEYAFVITADTPM